MAKKILALLLALTMVLVFVGCNNDSDPAGGDDGNDDAQPAALKVGVILLHDASIGYDFAHMQGIQTACETLGIDWNDNSQVVWKYNIGENENCYSAAIDLVDQGCNVIISDSFGHQSYMTLAASECPDVTFLIATGDTAGVDPYDNTHNFFTHTFESRYVSGVVGGMIVGTLALLFLVPTLFIVFQTLQEKIKPVEFTSPDWCIQAEIEENQKEPIDEEAKTDDDTK